jgi:hypothetical protein
MAQSLIRGSTQILDASITAAKFVASLNLATAQLQDGANFIQRGGSVAFTADQSMGGFKLTTLADAVNPQDALNLRTGQAMMAGIGVTARVRGVATTNQALTGLPTNDGITYTAAQIILLTAQSTASQNGPWAVASGAWTRPTFWAAASSQKSALFYVDEGTVNADTKWTTITDGAITVDTTSVTITKDTTGANYLAGNGILLTGSTFSTKLGNALAFDGSNNITITPNGTSLNVGASGIKITDGTPGQIQLAGSGNAFAATTVTGDVTINSAGVTAVNNTAGTGFLKYGNVVANETPGGAINGSNTAHTLAFTPQASSLQLFVNGQLQEPGSGNDYTISAAAITMLFALTTGDKLRAYYIK